MVENMALCRTENMDSESDKRYCNANSLLAIYLILELAFNLNSLRISF